MAGPFDLITGALGQTNPYDEARAYQQRQNAANNAALPNPDGSTTPVPGAPAPAGGPTPAQTQSPGATPDAVKTPEDLGSIMLDLQQYNERNQGFNQALGAGFAAFAQPRDRPMVSQMFNTQLGDPTKIGQMLMNTNSQQQGQNRMNALGQLISGPQGDAIAKQLNMGSAAQLRAAFLADPQSVSAMIEKTQQPTPQMANLDQITRYVDNVAQTKPGTSQEALAMIKNSMIAGIAGPDAEKAVGDALSYKQRTGKDAPWVHNGVIDQNDYNQYIQNRAELNKSVQESSAAHGQNIDKVTEFQHRVEALKNNAGLGEVLNYSGAYKDMAKWMLAQPEGATPTISDAIRAVPQWTGMTMSPSALAAIAELRQLRGQEYSTALHSIGSRFSSQEVAGVKSGMDQLGSLEMSPDDYQEQGLDRLIDDTKTIRGTSYGASQDFANMPKNPDGDDLRTYVNPIFTKGGSRNIEGSGSEDWADQTKMAPEEQAAASKLIGSKNNATGKPWTRQEVITMLRKEGKRPSGF